MAWGQPGRHPSHVNHHKGLNFLRESSCIKGCKAGPHGMANKGVAGPRHLCDNCSDGCKVLHVVVMEARRKMSRSAMARQVKSHQVKGWGEKGRHLEWNAPPRLV